MRTLQMLFNTETQAEMVLPYLFTLPEEQFQEILSERAVAIPTCEVCGKKFRRREPWMAGCWQVDARNNPDTVYVYRLHLQCFKRLLSDPARRGMLAIEEQASCRFAEYLQSLPTTGGAQ